MQPPPQQPTGTQKRRMTASVTIMPEAKKREGATQATRISDPAQLAMVQAGVIQMKPPGLLTRWMADAKCTKAFYSSELSSGNHAHFQGWHQWATEQQQSEVPGELLEAVRNASGRKKTDLEQKVRNMREKGAVAELRKCAAAALRPRPVDGVSVCVWHAAGGYGRTLWYPSSIWTSARTRARSTSSRRATRKKPRATPARRKGRSISRRP